MSSEYRKEENVPLCGIIIFCIFLWLLCCVALCSCGQSKDERIRQWQLNQARAELNSFNYLSAPRTQTEVWAREDLINKIKLLELQENGY